MARKSESQHEQQTIRSFQIQEQNGNAAATKPTPKSGEKENKCETHYALKPK